MKRALPLILALILLLSGCSTLVPMAEKKEAASGEIPVGGVSSFGSEDKGFRLTYPSSFTLTSSGDDFYEFKDEEKDLSLKLSIEENNFSGLSAEEYPQAMDMEMYSKVLSDNGFDRDIYVKNDSSYYYIYRLTDDNIYCLEYAYNGVEDEDELIDLLDLEVYDDFSGSDNTETLRSYAEAYLEDLYGDGDYTLEDNGTITKRSQEFLSFMAYGGRELLCLIAVNEDGVCYVDKTLSGLNYVNIEHLLYEPVVSEEEKLERYARHYYETIFGERPKPDELKRLDGDYSFDGAPLTVFSADEDGSTLFIGVTGDGIGYVDRTGTGNDFEKIEK